MAEGFASEEFNIKMRISAYTTMSKGMEVDLLEYIHDIESRDDHWLKVGCMWQIGYMRASCLQIEYEGA